MHSFWFDESHTSLRANARRFTATQLIPNVDAWEATQFPDKIFSLAAAAGLLGPNLPETIGGGGGDLFHAIVVAEEWMRASAGIASGLGSLSIALPPLIAAGSPVQLERFARPTLRGEEIGALAVTEPGTGSDVAGIRTTARRDGSDYVLNGVKTFITSGVRATWLMVLARTAPDPHRGLTFFIVPTSSQGFSVSRSLAKHGWRASDTAELSFEDVRVPASLRVGAEGDGFPSLMKNFDGERIMLAVQGHCLAEHALEEAQTYVRHRHAFGQPLHNFQVTRHKLADMATAVHSAKALTYATAAQFQAGRASSAHAAMAKNHAADVARKVCWEAVQIFGGMGYMQGVRVERLMRDARILHIGGGTREIMNEIIASNLPSL